jgi:hypothetical protein
VSTVFPAAWSSSRSHGRSYPQPTIINVKAIGLMAGVGLAISLDVEANSMIYRISVG